MRLIWPFFYYIFSLNSVFFLIINIRSFHKRCNSLYNNDIHFIIYHNIIHVWKHLVATSNLMLTITFRILFHYSIIIIIYNLFRTWNLYYFATFDFIFFSLSLEQKDTPHQLPLPCVGHIWWRLHCNATKFPHQDFFVKKVKRKSHFTSNSSPFKLPLLLLSSSKEWPSACGTELKSGLWVKWGWITIEQRASFVLWDAFCEKVCSFVSKKRKLKFVRFKPRNQKKRIHFIEWQFTLGLVLGIKIKEV